MSRYVVTPNTRLGQRHYTVVDEESENGHYNVVRPIPNDEARRGWYVDRVYRRGYSQVRRLLSPFGPRGRSIIAAVKRFERERSQRG